MIKLSIVVPTRDRADTLYFTLKTIVEQKYENLEIIVSDNYSSDNTYEVVKKFDDSRIIYINTGKRLSMSQNWEFALMHVTGDYVTYIGDDDGFIPKSIDSILRLMLKYTPSAIIWEKIEYGWPNHTSKDYQNTLKYRAKNNKLVKFKSKKVLKNVLQFKESYNKLPCIYNGFIATKIISKLRSESKNNKFFNSISPDVFSALILGMEISDYIYSTYPFTINGASKHSNGVSFMKDNEKLKETPSSKFNKEITELYDEKLVKCRTVSYCIQGELLKIIEYHPGYFKGDINWRAYILALINDSNNNIFSEEFIKSAHHTAQYINEVPYYESLINKKRPNNQLIIIDSNFRNQQLNTSFVNNVYDVSLLCEFLVNYYELESFEFSTFKRILKKFKTELKSELSY